MSTATLIRLSTGDEGTFGMLVFEDGLCFHSLELPWENNERSVSCIPCGMYVVKTTDSPRFGSSYKVEDVPGRTDILFHRGNWAGRKSMPELDSNVEGCILLGDDRGEVSGAASGSQQGVKNSRKAVDEMYQHLKMEPFNMLVMSRIDDELFIP